MKKSGVAALFLTLILLFVPLSPSLAAEDADPPIWKQWGYDSLQDFMDSMGLETEEEYYRYIEKYVEDWEEEKRVQQRWEEWKRQYLSSHPNYLQELLDMSPALWEELSYESLEEFMLWNGLQTTEEYEDYLIRWHLYDEFSEELRKEEIAKERLAMGGPAEGVGVMWNDSYVSFPDAQPEIVDGRTMVPVRAFMELTGAEVSFDGGARAVSLALADGRRLRFVVGETTVYVTQDGVETTVAMDVAPYIRNDRTYVPVRFFSEALGLDVFWDGDFQTAVVLDRTAIVKSLDEPFTIINRALAGPGLDPEKSYETRTNMKVELRLFDSLNGDRTARASGAFSAITQGSNADMQGKLDISGLLSLLVAEGDASAEALDSLKLLERLDFEIILNADEGMLYMRSPAMSELSGAGENVWFAQPLTLGDYSAYAESATLGSVLYAAICNEYAGVHALSNLREAAAAAAQLIGDDCFSAHPSGWELSYGVDEIGLWYEELTGMPSEGMKDTGFRLLVKKSGGYSCSFQLAMEQFGETIQCKGSFEVSAAEGRFDLSLQLKDNFSLSLSADSVTNATARRPRALPPEGAVIQEAGNLTLPDEYFMLGPGGPLPAALSVISHYQA